MNQTTSKRIKFLFLQHDIEQHPNVPVNYLPPPKVSDASANDLTKTIIRFLKCSGHQAERVSNTGRFIEDKIQFQDAIGRNRTAGTGKYIPGQGTNGTADIHAQIRPTGAKYAMPVKIEVKFGNDRQSEAQKVYQANIEQAGGVYIIARNMDEFVEWYDRFVEGVEA